MQWREEVSNINVMPIYDYCVKNVTTISSIEYRLGICITSPIATRNLKKNLCHLRKVFREMIGE